MQRILFPASSLGVPDKIKPRQPDAFGVLFWSFFPGNLPNKGILGRGGSGSSVVESVAACVCLIFRLEQVLGRGEMIIKVKELLI